MPGYANRIRTLHFPELSEDGDDVFVVIRNPQTTTLPEVHAQGVATGPDGTPDEAEAEKAVFDLMSRLVLGGHVYDATVLEFDDHGVPVDQPLLAMPLTSETARKLPLEIINQVANVVREAQNPQ